ncbi:MAG: MATE family efflux transporter [Chthoniobacterales bacterium]
MRGVGTFTTELKQTMSLALPIMIAQVGQMLMGLTDTLIVGRLGVTPLAAVAFSNTIVTTLFVFGIGMLTSIGVVGAQAHGAGHWQTKQAVLRISVWLSTGLGLSLVLLVLLAGPWLRIFGQTELVLVTANPFLGILAWSLVPALGYMGAKIFCDSLGRPTVPMLILYLAVLVNALLNWLLVFGNWGAPRLGLEGSAWATVLSRSVAMLGTVGYALRITNADLRVFSLIRIDWSMVKSLLRVGTPVALQYFSEVAAFSFGAIMMGWIGAGALAAHQIAITCAATTFMFPLGVSQAVSVRIGHAVGSGTQPMIRRIGFGGLGMSAAVMAGFATLFTLWGRTIAQLFSSDAEVTSITAALLVIAGLFQLADGVQVTAGGALRGLADVRVPMWLAYLFYWGVAIPAAYLLAFVLKTGAIGIWIGLALGLFTAATVLTLRFILLTEPGRAISMVVPAER